MHELTEPGAVNPTGLLESYAVELLCPTPVELDEALRTRLAAALGRVSPGEMVLTAAHDGRDQLVVEYVGPLRDAGSPPAWTLAHPATSDLDAQVALHGALAQSWWWDEAPERAHAGAHRLVLADHGFLTLDYVRRLTSFRTVLAAALEAIPCAAVHWLPSQQVVEPAAILASNAEDPDGPLPGGLNVRFYRVDPRDSGAGDQEHVMDTLGLGALGLIDLQCHFRGLDPEAVGEVLLRTGCYLFERGLVVRDGDSVQGPGAQDRWLARKTIALAAPEREVLALDPGFPFAL